MLRPPPGEVDLRALATQNDASDIDPAPDAIYEVGTLASVLRLLLLPDSSVKVRGEGARVRKYTGRADYFEAVPARLEKVLPCTRIVSTAGRVRTKSVRIDGLGDSSWAEFASR